ncbi:hypothetical protein FRC02_011867 [Tulasnella sp. 418]|nr:hypothetical protein FRC02_011867 [Tulasnella sp. 418]
MLRLKGGKPVIYLYPPSVLTATVSLSLIPQWRFSALYPFTPITAAKVGTETGEALVWVVTAHPDGTLRQEPSGVDTSYLLWEAETHLDLLDSPPSSPTSASLPSDLTSDCDDTESFIPGRSKCAPHNSVLLSVQEAPLYLNKALFELGLHTEARTSFITYWLPSLLKHQFIALRFVPQSAYEKAAPLDISPTPDLVTRVFMLFQGVSPLEVDDSVWQEAENRAKDPPSIWNNVVGIDEAKQEDEKLFRVLEWGGMEVY